MTTIARTCLVAASLSAFASGCNDDRREEPVQAPSAVDAPATPAPAAAAEWKRVDLAAEGAKSGASSLSGTLEVPAASTLEFFTSKGVDDMPVDSVSVKSSAFTVTLDGGPGAPDGAKSLAGYLQQAKIVDRDVLEKSELPGGSFALSYRTGGNVAVVAVHKDLSCAVTLEPKDAAHAPAALRLCSSYQPATTAAAPTPPAVAPPSSSPVVTLSDLKGKKLERFVDKKRGFWTVAGGKAISRCETAVAQQLPAVSELFQEALSLATDGEFIGVLDCEGMGDRTSCAYQHPTGDGAASFVFVAGKSGKPVLAAVVTDSSASDDARKAPIDPCGAR